MKYWVGVVIAVFFTIDCIDCCKANDVETSATEDKTIQILFVGNSYTFYNNLNEMVQRMLTVSGASAHTERCTPGGWRLRQHFNADIPKKKQNHVPAPEHIKKKQWDYVVLQEQSCGPVDQRAEFLEYGKKLNELILANCPSTRVLLYQTWGRCDGMFDGYGDDETRKVEVISAFTKRYSTPNEATIKALKDGMQGGYDLLAKEIHATVAPVGKAFKEAGDKVELYADEGKAKPHHPSPSGSYLAACVFFKTITGDSPVGMWQKLQNAGNDLKVNMEDAAYLEGIAELIVE